ncbi:glutathione synthase [Clostridia bacterium]|nr:glutathione synthase [Clostridia bacterium]
MNICFIINDWNTMVPETETTLRIIQEACKRNHRVGILYPNNITIRNNQTYGFFKMIKDDRIVSENMVTFYKNTCFKEEMLPLKGFDVVFLRKNPPLDGMLLNFLDSINDEVFIVNDINGLRKANNKLYTSTFYDPDNTYIPKTYVSKNTDYLKRIVAESPDNKMILKPVDGYGGSGVIIIEKDATQNLSSLLDFYINTDQGKKYVMLQEYIEGAEHGDVRVLILNGKVIGAYKRVPADNDIRSNIHAGGSAQKYVLDKEEESICKKIATKLKNDGIYFSGIDLINKKLIEVNVQSPGGIVNINKFNRVKLQKNILDFVEEVIEEKEHIFKEKSHNIKNRESYKNEVRNA